MAANLSFLTAKIAPVLYFSTNGIYSYNLLHTAGITAIALTHIRSLLDLHDFPTLTLEQRQAFVQKDIVRSTLYNPFFSKWVYMRDKEVAGFVTYYLRNNRLDAWIVSLAVATPFQHTGIGTALVQQVLGDCQARSVHNIGLYTAESNGNYYKKLGFEVVAQNNDSDRTLTLGRELPRITRYT